MSTGNDKKILALREKIQEKKDKIGKVKFVPTTSCSIDWNGNRFNLHALNKDQLDFLLIYLNSCRLSMVDLGMSKMIISGFSLMDWIADIKMKLAVISQKEEENNLKALESKLNTLLSEDKKTELELASIEGLLN